MPTGEQGGRDRQPISPAKFWLKSALVVVVVGSLLAWAWMPSRPEEPFYQGKRLSEWLNYFVSHGPNTEEVKMAQSALRKIGTNGIPSLLRMIQTPDSTFRTMLKALIQKQSFFGSAFADAEDIRYMALFGFRLLGEDAKGAVPELLTVVKRESGTVGREEAIAALGDIGPSAQATVPDLPRLLEASTAARITKELENIGYARVTLDPQGYRRGGANDLTPKLFV